MQSKTLVRLATCFILALAITSQAEDKKADPNGTWKWTITGQNGQARETTLTLKTEGDKLTGKISGRNGDIDIKDATLKGDEIAFQVTREVNGNSFTQKYNGKISGDAIKGKIAFDRNGEPQSRDWDAKRETDKKEEAKPAAGATK